MARMTRRRAPTARRQRVAALVIAAALSAGLACVPPGPVASLVPTAATPPRDTVGRAAPKPAVRHDDRARGAPAVVAVPIAGSSLVRARAAVEIEAPIDAVRAVVLDLERYADFMPRCSRSRVFGTTARGGHDVYLELDELGGAIHLWVRLEISRRAIADGIEAYDARLITGNVDSFRASWRLEDLGQARTLLTFESYVDPGLPRHPELVNRGNMEGAKESVLALKRRAERGRVDPR